MAESPTRLEGGVKRGASLESVQKETQDCEGEELGVNSEGDNSVADPLRGFPLL